MNHTRVELKTAAKNRLSGNWGLNIVVMLLAVYIPALILGGITGLLEGCSSAMSSMESYTAAGVVSGISSLISVAVGIIVCGPLMIGYDYFSLIFMRGGETEYLTPYKIAFNNTNFMRFVSTYFMMQLFIFLWSLLLIIPGIVKSFSYAMTPYILKDHPEMNWKEAITESRRMMDGHKGELFVLYLSFIGWLILTCLTFGILAIYVTPYMQMTVTDFYRSLKGEDINAFPPYTA